MSRNKNIGWTKAWVRVGQKSTSTLQVTSIPIPWQQSNPQTHTAEFAQNWALWLVCWSYCVNILLVILRSADPLLCIAQFQVICLQAVWCRQSAPRVTRCWSYGASQGWWLASDQGEAGGQNMKYALNRKCAQHGVATCSAGSRC